MRVLVLADTHAPRRWRGIPAALRGPLARADLILHAGDVCTREVLDQLAAFAPMKVAFGNNDHREVAAWGATETVELVAGGVHIAMIHDAGSRHLRGRRMRQQFPLADIVIFGHSHIPSDGVDAGVHLFNPGSPTDRRRQPVGSYGVLELDAGRVVHHEILPVLA